MKNKQHSGPLRLLLNTTTAFAWEEWYCTCEAPRISCATRSQSENYTSRAPLTANSEKEIFSQSTPLTHLHEELSLLHHGLASFAAFLDHPVGTSNGRARHTYSSDRRHVHEFATHAHTHTHTHTIFTVKNPSHTLQVRTIYTFINHQWDWRLAIFV